MRTQTKPVDTADQSYRGSPANEPSAEELAALRVISEQAAVPLDQLARFLGSTPAQVGALTMRLEEARWARSDTFLSADYPWVWLTRKGASLSGTGLSHRSYPPFHSYLNHRRAVNEVRLHLERLEPHGKWISETQVQGQRPRGAQIPDGVFEVKGERHAVEVELSVKTKLHYQQVLAENSARYDAVLYFCGRKTGGQLRGFKEAGNWPKLIVRDLPGDQGALTPRRRRDAKRKPKPWEIEILSLISEQGMVRVDHLVRFLRRRPDEIEQIVDDLLGANYVTRERYLHDEPDWVALTWVGNRVSETDLEFFRGRGGGVEQRMALNELRLYMASRSPEALWISRRRLVKTHGKTANVPGAEVQLKDRRYAINIRLTPNNGNTLVPRTHIQNAAYDAVIFFCATRRARRYMEGLQEQNRWSKVVIRDMPSSEEFSVEPRPAERLVDALLGG